LRRISASHHGLYIRFIPKPTEVVCFEEFRWWAVSARHRHMVEIRSNRQIDAWYRSFIIMLATFALEAKWLQGSGDAGSLL
jgi:hypothetical protein